jgi:hypothetical protein
MTYLPSRGLVPFALIRWNIYGYALRIRTQVEWLNIPLGIYISNIGSDRCQ